MSARITLVALVATLSACSPAQVYVGTLTTEPLDAKLKETRGGVEAILSPSLDPKSQVLSLFDDVPLLLERSGTLKVDQLVFEQGDWVQRVSVYGWGNQSGDELRIDFTLITETTDDGQKTKTERHMSYLGQRL